MTAFADLAEAPRWVAWQTEQRAAGSKPTKIPYAPQTGRKAKADDPATWGTRVQAEARAAKLPKPFGSGGVGIELGDLGDGHSIGGIDLDTCRDSDGTLASWAAEVIERFGSYTETSPSGSGVKLFFVYTTADLPALRSATGNEHGKTFKRAGGEHPPAIELHISNRYFAVTDQHLAATPTELRPIALVTLLWLIREAGPAFQGAASGASHNGDRSAAAFRKGLALRAGGATFEEMVAALRDDPETADWTRDKGEPNDQRELRRIWEKAGANSPEAIVSEFNARYSVVNEAGKAVVYAPRHDPLVNRQLFDRLAFEDLRKLYCNRRICVGMDDKGRQVIRGAAEVWLKSPDRRQFIGGVIFDPAARHADPSVLNLWQGFAVKPKLGNWSLLRDHIRDVICGGNEEHFAYLLGWMARMVQHPAEQGEVAVVMRGGEGTGKGTLAKALMRILGQHALTISNAKHLTGNFNAHLPDCVFLFADEAFYAGDKQHVGVLKAIVTEEIIAVEAKYQNAINVRNMLHLMMASNEEWVVPASLDARRFFVLEVTDAHANDHAYFAAIWRQMDAGGYEAMLHDLLHHNLSTFNVRRFPVTEGLRTQRKLTLGTEGQWWLDVLQRGYVFRSKLGLEHEFGKWCRAVSTELLFASYTAFAEARRERHPLSREYFGRFMRHIEARPKRLNEAPIGEHIKDVPTTFGTSRQAAVVMHPRPTGFLLEELDVARQQFLTATGLKAEWLDDAADEADEAGETDAAA